MKILVINGPNINMLGIRETEIYGHESYYYLVDMIQNEATKLNIEVKCLQSNSEGKIIDWIQSALFDSYDGIIINPAGYTHTSVAIADAIKAISPIPVVEVHLSDIDKRENFRKFSYIKPYCVKTFKGYGIKGYLMALNYLVNIIGEEN